MSQLAGPARRPWLGVWIAAWCALVALQLGASLLPGTTPLWVQPSALFWIVVVAASLCALAAAALLVEAHTSDLAEVGLLGAFTMAVSLLPLVHGLTVPGVLYGANAATMSSVFVAVPVASLALLPLLAPRTRPGRAVLRRWRAFVAVHIGATAALCGALLARPSLLPFPAMGTATAIIVALASLSVCAALSARQLRLAWIGRSRASLGVSLGIAMIGASSLVWAGRAPFTAGFWLAHAFDIAGVFGATILAAVAYRRGTTVRELLRPLTVHEPLRAFEIGLDPLVHRFVALLEAKDPITRDHVVRTAQLAMRTGAALHLPAPELRTLGLGALLHDVGKLEIPDAILQQPGRLSDNEFAIVRTHTVAGERLVLASEVLGEIAPIVRGHHERIDGRGYPDGLRGEAIPLLARIVSVCDAFDAMAHTRQYREGMGTARACAILREHAGAQWDERIVATVVALVEGEPEVHETTALDAVGRAEPFCGCADALPEPVAAQAVSPS
jgi:HD-GYP domain-containing protein (c-di-GMP phosphodiesterase class II)